MNRSGGTGLSGGHRCMLRSGVQRGFFEDFDQTVSPVISMAYHRFIRLLSDAPVIGLRLNRRYRKACAELKTLLVIQFLKNQSHKHLNWTIFERQLLPSNTHTYRCSQAFT